MQVDLSKLVITKALTRSEDQYADGNKQAHVELAARMKKRDPNAAPAIGDRIPYVMIKGAVKAKAWEKAEDPIYVLENNVPIDSTCASTHSRAQMASSSAQLLSLCVVHKMRVATRCLHALARLMTWSRCHVPLGGT